MGQVKTGWTVQDRLNRGYRACPGTGTGLQRGYEACPWDRGQVSFDLSGLVQAGLHHVPVPDLSHWHSGSLCL